MLEQEDSKNSILQFAGVHPGHDINESAFSVTKWHELCTSLDCFRWEFDIYSIVTTNSKFVHSGNCHTVVLICISLDGPVYHWDPSLLMLMRSMHMTDTVKAFTLHSKNGHNRRTLTMSFPLHEALWLKYVIFRNLCPSAKICRQ